MNRVSTWGFAAALLAALMVGSAGADELPDELTVKVGKVPNVGDDVTLVLTKRSVRAPTYKFYVQTKEGLRRAEPFPVSTYRGHVQGDPSMRVNGNIEPGGLLSANFSEGRDIIAHVTKLKVDVPAGKCTPFGVAGNTVVPLSSVKTRVSPTPGGSILPTVPMRLVRAKVWVAPECVSTLPSLEAAVSCAEQRINDCDFNWARNVGLAWEIDTLEVEVFPEAAAGVKWIEDKPVSAAETPRIQFAGFCKAGNGCRGGAAWAAGLGQEAGGLMHEAGHAFGTGHGNDKNDAMKGNRAFFGPNNTRVIVNTIKSRTESDHPAVIYNGQLPPQAQDDITETPKGKPVTIDVLDNDFDGNGDSLSIRSVGECRRGGTVTVTPDKLKVVYTPPPGFVGLDSFRYEVVDATGCASRAGEVDVNVIVDGVAAHFDFDQIENGGTFANKGPVGSAATAHRFTPVLVDGIRGKAVFDGINAGWGAGKHMEQLVISECGDPGPGNLSVSLWVLYPRIHVNMKVPHKKWMASSALVIIGKGAIKYTGNPLPHAPGWAMINRPRFEGFKFMGRTGDSNFDVRTTEKIEPMKWYHLVMVIDRKSQRIRGWVNNQEMTESTETAFVPPGDIADASDVRLLNGEIWQYWQAYPVVIDELKLFNVALTPAQVAELYAEGKDAKVPDMSAFMKDAKPYAHVPEDGRFEDVAPPKPKETE